MSALNELREIHLQLSLLCPVLRLPYENITAVVTQWPESRREWLIYGPLPEMPLWSGQWRSSMLQGNGTKNENTKRTGWERGVPAQCALYAVPSGLINFFGSSTKKVGNEMICKIGRVMVV